MASVEIVTALCSGAVGVGTIAVGLAGKRTRRQERRDDFAALTERQDRELARVDEKLAAVNRELLEQKRGREEDRRECEAERLESRRKVNVLVRILIRTYRHLDVLSVPYPELQPDELTALQEHHIR